MTRSGSRSNAPREWRPLAFASAFVATTFVSCTSFDGLGLVRAKSHEHDAAPLCRHAGVAGITAGQPIAQQGNFEFTAAIHDFNPPSTDPSLETLGFDLDGKCTGEGEGPSCVEPSWAAGDHRDGPDGRDNSVATFLLGADASIAQSGQATVVAFLGLTTAVIRVRNYNGTLYDNDVEVAFFAATLSPDFKNYVPNRAKWDGTDAWKPLVEWTLPGDAADSGSTWKPKYVSANAYVTNGVLVAHFDAWRGAPDFNFSNFWVQAKVQDHGDGTWSLHDGVYTGRVRIDDLLASVQAGHDPATGLDYTCTDSPGYLQIKKNACSAADIRFSGDDPTAPCDAASWAWSFNAEPARLSDEVDQDRAADFYKCPVGKRPSEDHCATLDGDAQ